MQHRGRPAGYDGSEPVPAVLLLRGFMQSWRSIRDIARFERIANEQTAPARVLSPT